MSSNPVVVIAGGGTGGHVVPGLAIARALVRRGAAPESIHWVGSSRGMEVDAVPAAGFDLTVLPGRGLERKFTISNVANAFNIARATFSAIGVLRRIDPSVVVSLGGYAAVPAGVAAALMGIPIVIQEQNARPSLANKLIGRFARHSAVLVEGTGLRNEVVTGNPLREEIENAATLPRAEAREHLRVPADRLLILAFGGSLGSLRINRATLELAEAWDDRNDVAIHHVIGTRDWDSLQGRIAKLAGSRLMYRAVEYENNMATALAAADLAVARAGGMTVSELAVFGLPAVLVPLPIAPNDAQRHNARALSDAGAAVLVTDSELDGVRLATEIEQMIASGLDGKAVAARSVGFPRAADDVACLIEGAVDG